MWKFFETIERQGKWILGVLFLFLLVNSIQRADQKSDFLDYYHASERWSTGENLYRFDVAEELQTKIKTTEDLFRPENLSLLLALQNETATYIYPPLFSFLLIPITYLSESNAALVFEVISWISLVSIFILLFQNKELNLEKSKFPLSILLLMLLFNFRYIESHIQNNQVGIFLILLVLASLLVKHDSLSGFLLALAVSIKITPLVFFLCSFTKKIQKNLLVFFGTYDLERNPTCL